MADGSVLHGFVVASICHDKLKGGGSALTWKKRKKMFSDEVLKRGWQDEVEEGKGRSG